MLIRSILSRINGTGEALGTFYANTDNTLRKRITGRTRIQTIKRPLHPLFSRHGGK